MGLYFSVIIPLFNKEKSIRNTLASVINQTFRDFELIIVNDGSTDKSLEAVNDFTDSQIIVINQLNEGVSSARNKGIYASQGQYIAFLDADDIWEPFFLNTMQLLIEDFPKASFFGCQYAQKNGDEIQVVNSVHRKRGYVKNYFSEVLKAPLVWSSSIVIKRNCFKEIGYFNPKYSRGEDIDVWSRLGRKYIMAFTPCCMSYYTQDAENRACNTKPSLDKYYLVYNLWNLPKFERKYMSRFATNTISEMWHARQFKKFTLLLIRYNIYIPVLIKDKIENKLKQIFLNNKH